MPLTEDSPMEEPVTPVTGEPAPDPTPSPPESDSAPSEPEAQQPNGIPAEQIPPPNSVKSEATAEPDAVPLVQTAQVNSDGVVPPFQPAAVATPAAVEPPRAKRKLEEVGFEKSTYFKIRKIVKDLRPLFVQVYENPNFRETNMPTDILKEISSVLDLSKQLRSELTAFNEPLKPSSIREESKENFQVPQTEDQANNSVKTENDIASEDVLKDVPKNLEDGFKGSYVVGGSPIGWNYLVYPGSQPAYYGRSKAEKLAQITNQENI